MRLTISQEALIYAAVLSFCYDSHVLPVRLSMHMEKMAPRKGFARAEFTEFPRSSTSCSSLISKYTSCCRRKGFSFFEPLTDAWHSAFHLRCSNFSLQFSYSTRYSGRIYPFVASADSHPLSSRSKLLQRDNPQGIAQKRSTVCRRAVRAAVHP